jgi:hypothetical protein
VLETSRPFKLVKSVAARDQRLSQEARCRPRAQKEGGKCKTEVQNTRCVALDRRVWPGGSERLP